MEKYNRLEYIRRNIQSPNVFNEEIEEIRMELRFLNYKFNGLKLHDKRIHHEFYYVNDYKGRYTHGISLEVYNLIVKEGMRSVSIEFIEEYGTLKTTLYIDDEWIDSIYETHSEAIGEILYKYFNYFQDKIKMSKECWEAMKLYEYEINRDKQACFPTEISEIQILYLPVLKREKKNPNST